ncbi:unnamed protein product [Thlaspi arvense]|uniref:Uncharacterized protein n=1 Tax=Thlaspi arvense TaxID=13288 RepID=A0AAU9SSR4_THLAR|nr:unnamed protein product [Thlaspi arvense]
MGKSESSSKKIKRSKDSSKLRSVKKKKTKRSKPKKIRRIKDYSDESESSGSDSSLYSSSSSEDDYRREKRRSKVSKKKRSRKRYFSSESEDDDDDDIRLLKKKKRSKSKEEHAGTKKKNKKRTVSRKRRKRDSSSSYSSSDSQSDDGSESDGKRRIRNRGRRSKDELQELSEPDECWQVDDEVMGEKKNPRRLKSIVVVSYSYDNDDERKKDLVDDHGDESDGDRIVDDDERYVENGRKTVGYDESEEDIGSETSKDSYPDNRLKDDDLEAILKQRALENLKRFRGETQKNEISREEVSSSVSEGEETLQIESEKAEEPQDDGLVEQSLSVSAGSKDLEASQKILQVVNVKESGMGLADLASQQDQQPGDSAKVKASSGLSSCTTKRKLIRPVLGQKDLVLASRKDAEAESISGNTIDKSCPETSLALATKNVVENLEPTKGSSTSSSHAETEPLDEIERGSQPEEKTIDETKDESQYEKKTMTVMRGGEMVQVSYKVYIPKKTSSLGRRQLRR